MHHSQSQGKNRECTTHSHRANTESAPLTITGQKQRVHHSQSQGKNREHTTHNRRAKTESAPLTIAGQKTESAPLTITGQKQRVHHSQSHGKHQTAMLGKQLHLAAQCYTQTTRTAKQPKELKAVLPPSPPPPTPTYRKLVDTTSAICDRHNGFFFTEPSQVLLCSIQRKTSVPHINYKRTISSCKKDSRFKSVQCVKARFKAQVLLKQSTYYLWKCTLKIKCHTHTRIDIQHINTQGSPTHII